VPVVVVVIPLNHVAHRTLETRAFNLEAKLASLGASALERPGRALVTHLHVSAHTVVAFTIAHTAFFIIFAPTRQAVALVLLPKLGPPVGDDVPHGAAIVATYGVPLGNEPVIRELCDARGPYRKLLPGGSVQDDEVAHELIAGADALVLVSL
jgi:hypothetical protein